MSPALACAVAEPPNVRLVTSAGVHLRLQPVGTYESAALHRLLGSLSHEDLRFRFLVSHRPDPAQISELVRVDHRRTEHILAIDEWSRRPVASLLMAADPQMRTAEVAIVVASGACDRGIGWALLKHAADLARSRGIETLRSIESRANHDALEVERAPGFVAKPVEGDPALVMLEAALA